MSPPIFDDTLFPFYIFIVYLQFQQDKNDETADGISLIGSTQKADYNNQAGSAMFTAPADNKLKYLWLIVMGAPNTHWKDLNEGKDAQWPYMLKFKGTKPLSENLK